MHEFLLSASAGLLHYLTHSVVMLAVIGGTAWLGDRWLRRLGPQAQHRMWVGALLAGVLLPLLPTGLLSALRDADASMAGGTVTVTYHVIAAAAERWAISPRLGAMLAGVYLLIMLFYGSRLLWRCRRTATMARRSAALPLDASARMLMDSMARRLGITPPEVRCGAGMCGPVVAGVRRPMLLVPEGFFSAENVGDAAAAVAHECAHIGRRDFAKNLIYEVVAMAVAYHPACWLMRRRIAETRELVCDEMAAGVAGDRPEYAASLLRLAQAMAAPTVQTSQAIGVFDANILEERIMRLTMDVPKVSRTRRVVLAVVTAGALLGGAMTAMALSFDVAPQDATTATPVKAKIYKVGNGVTAPILTHSVDAEYSKKAKDAKHQGVSVVSCIVDTDGMPQHVHTVKKLGMGLDEKALEAVRQYRFKPSTLDGKPVAVAITIEVNFHIY